MIGNNDKIVIFDGYCNLCDSTIQFIIKEDKNEQFKFANFHSSFVKRNLPELYIKDSPPKTVLFYYHRKIWTKSDAILKILILLGGYFKIFAYTLKIFPRFLRDIVYDFIADNRYKWFGKKSKCLIPTQGLLNKFYE